MEYPLETSFYVTDKESIENGNFEKYPWIGVADFEKQLSASRSWRKLKKISLCCRRWFWEIYDCDTSLFSMTSGEKVCTV